MALRKDEFELLPGLRWSGKLRVIAFDAVDPFRIIVAFDARTADGTYVYDHAALTYQQFKAWTGEEPPLTAPDTCSRCGKLFDAQGNLGDSYFLCDECAAKLTQETKQLLGRQ